MAREGSRNLQFTRLDGPCKEGRRTIRSAGVAALEAIPRLRCDGEPDARADQELREHDQMNSKINALALGLLCGMAAMATGFDADARQTAQQERQQKTAEI